MSNGEVKRWYLYTENEALYAVSKNQRGFVPDASTIEVMRVEDHERIVAELKEKLEVFRNREYGFENELELKQTIARQAKVIEKLKERLTSWISETHPNDEHLRNMCLMVEERELAAIEKGEA